VKPNEFDHGTRFLKPRPSPRNETLSLLICTAFAALIAVWMWVAGGCAPIPKPIAEPVTITLPETRVHIVPSYQFFPGTSARYGVLGCATSGGDVYVMGVQTEQGIVVDYRVLGHELAHLMHWRDGRVSNPDKK
jgi:hypothetical protein